MFIYIASDHRGFQLKTRLVGYLKGQGHEVFDLGAMAYDERDDYPDYAELVARKVALAGGRGILICGSGAGVNIVANKFKGIRSFMGIASEQAAAAANDDDANILSLASDYLSDDEAEKIVSAWLSVSFSGEDKYLRRVEKIKKIEEENFK